MGENVFFIHATRLIFFWCAYEFASFGKDTNFHAQPPQKMEMILLQVKSFSGQKSVVLLLEFASTEG
jgi:hypothetical protein